MSTEKKTTKKTNKRVARKRPTKKAVAKKGAASSKKSTLEGLVQTNGKSYAQSVDTVRKLEDLLDVKQTNPFGTGDLRILEENLSSMNLSDMQEVAVRAGIFPNGNKTVLKNKLIKAFKNLGLGVVESVVDKGSPVQLDPRNPRHKSIIDYLNNP
jgi:hypothetical protein